MRAAREHPRSCRPAIPLIETRLAERHRGRFAGVGTICAAYDSLNTFNAALDALFAVKTLLAPDQDIDLVKSADPQGGARALAAVIERAMSTPDGRARLALAGSFNNVADWYLGLQPRPTDLAERMRQQALWLLNAYTLGFGPVARADLEQRPRRS